MGEFRQQSELAVERVDELQRRREAVAGDEGGDLVDVFVAGGGADDPGHYPARFDAPACSRTRRLRSSASHGAELPESSCSIPTAIIRRRSARSSAVSASW